jgi:hypothetical protein
MSDQFNNEPNNQLPNNNPPANPPQNEWLNALPETLRNNPNISRYQTLEQFANAKLHLDKHYGVPAEHIIKLPSFDDAEGLSQLYTKLGRPETSDKYEISVPEGVAFDDTRSKALKDEFHKLGLSQKQAEGIMNTYKGFIEADMNNLNAQTEAENVAGELQLRNQWGKQYDEILTQTQEYMKNNVDEKTMDMLEKHGLDKVPALIQVVGNLVRQVSNLSTGGGLPGGRGQPGGSLTPAEAKAQIASLKTNKDFTAQLQDKSHPNHGAAVERWKNLYAMAGQG